MKPGIHFFLMLFILTGYNIQAQLCINPTDSVYGLNSITASGFAGQIAGVNVNNAGVQTIGSPAAAGDNANGLGFSQLDGRFYFFNQCGNGTIEFISYAPASGSKITLATPPATITTAHKIRSGTCNSGGNGYYTINPNAAVPYLYYYNIPLNTWTTITSTFLNTSGTTVTDFKTLNSGDMTFDGNGNLWILCSGTSSGSKYSLFKITAPVPTSAVASITVDTVVGITATPGGVNFTGVAFNTAGKLYLTTGSGIAVGNNQLYEMASPGVLTLKGTVTNGYGDDLASCYYPFGVLPVIWIYFNAVGHHETIELEWKVVEDGNTSQYNVEYSNDSANWRTVFSTPGNNTGNATQVYRYIYPGNENGNMYFRIAQISLSGTVSYSTIKKFSGGTNNDISIFPNPAGNIIWFNNKEDAASYHVQVFDMSNRMVLSAIIKPGQQSLDISRLQKGFLILKISSGENQFLKSYKLVKQ